MQFYKHWSLKARIAFWATLTMTVLVASGTALALWRVYGDMRQTASDSQTLLIDSMAENLDAKIEDRRHAVSLASAVLGRMALQEPEDFGRYFAARPVLQSMFDLVFATDASGRILFDTPAVPGRAGQSIADRDYFKQVMATGQPVISQPLAGKATLEPSIVFAAPLRDKNGQLNGVVAGVLFLDRPNFLSALGSVRIGKTGHVALITRGPQPQVVVHAQRDLVLSAVPSPARHPDEHGLAMHDLEGVVEGRNPWGVEALWSYRKLASVPWVLTTTYPLAEAHAHVKSTLRDVAMMGLIALLVANLLLWWLTARLLRPLDQLRRAMVDARDRNAPVPVDLGDSVAEVRDVVKAYNRLMAHNLEVSAEMAANRHQLRLITDNLPALVSYVDASQRYTFVNAHFAREVGLRPEHVIGRQVSEIRAPFWESIRAHLHRALEGHKVRFEGDGVVHGKVVHYQSSYVPDIGPDGQVRGLFAMTMNITQRKEAELRQKVSEERVRNILTHAPDAFASLDEQGVVNEWNRQAELTFGWSRDEVVGRPMHEVVVPPELHEQHLALMARFRDAHAAKAPCARTEFAGYCRDGRRIPVEMSVAFIREGDALVAHVFMRDISERKAASQKVAASEKRLRDITNNLPAMIAYFDRHERCQFANETALKLQGVSREELPGCSFRAAVGEAAYAQQADAIRTVLTGQPASVEGHVMRRDRALQFQSHFVPDRSEDGEVRGFYSMTFDITAMKVAEAQRAEGARRLRTIADNLPVLIAYIGDDERVQFINETFREWLGVDPAQALAQPFAHVVGPQFYERSQPHLMRALHGERASFDVVVDTRGASRHLHTVFVADRDANGQVVGLHVLSSDVTKMKAVEHQLVEQARLDVLTGLPNRRAFDERLAQAIARSRRSEQPMAVIFLDVDHFKQINDTYGHGIGDQVLTEFARRLQQSVRVTDTVARLAGDEFVVILELLSARDDVVLVARKIAEAIRLPFMLDNLMLQVTSSQGIAYLEGQDVTAADMMEKADSALYDAKRAGRNTYALSSL